MPAKRDPDEAPGTTRRVCVFSVFYGHASYEAEPLFQSFGRLPAGIVPLVVIDNGPAFDPSAFDVARKEIQDLIVLPNDQNLGLQRAFLKFLAWTGNSYEMVIFFNPDYRPRIGSIWRYLDWANRGNFDIYVPYLRGRSKRLLSPTRNLLGFQLPSWLPIGNITACLNGLMCRSRFLADAIQASPVDYFMEWFDHYLFKFAADRGSRVVVDRKHVGRHRLFAEETDPRSPVALLRRWNYLTNMLATSHWYFPAYLCGRTRMWWLQRR